MATVSYEDACKCPKCENPMVEISSTPAPTERGAQIKTLECQTELCRWYGERKLVQINKDGTVPVREASKEFKPYTPSQQAALTQRLEQNAEVLRRGNF
jgi:hypothetical protein